MLYELSQWQCHACNSLASGKLRFEIGPSIEHKESETLKYCMKQLKNIP